MIRLLITGFAVLALAACSRVGGLGEQQRQQDWQALQQVLGKIDRWDIRARAVVALEGEAYNIGINWQRDSTQFNLLLEAPFGQGVISIDKLSASAYRLRLPDGRELQNTTPEALLEEVIGWSIPIGGLEYWIRGMPRPDSKHIHRLNNRGLARSIDQDRWSIRYIDYFEQAQVPPLPRRIKLARSGMNLKLVIERWQAVEIEDNSSDLFPEFD